MALNGAPENIQGKIDLDDSEVILQVPRASAEILERLEVPCEFRSLMTVKGKGEMELYLIKESARELLSSSAATGQRFSVELPKSSSLHS